TASSTAGTSWSWRSDPRDDRPLNRRVDLGLYRGILARELERVIALGDRMQHGGRPQRADDRHQLRRRAKRVARSLHEEHRPPDGGKMLVAPLVRLARRMQRIPEQD